MTTTTTNVQQPVRNNNVVDFHHENFDAKPKQRHIFEDDIDFVTPPKSDGIPRHVSKPNDAIETLREDYAARSRGETTTSNNNDNNAKGGDALEVLGTSRLLEAAIDSTTASEEEEGDDDDVGRCDVHGIAPLPPRGWTSANIFKETWKKRKRK